MRRFAIAALLLAPLMNDACFAQKPYPTQSQEPAAAATFTAALPEGSPAQIRETLSKAHAAVDLTEALDFTPFDGDAQRVSKDRIKSSKDIFNELYDYAHKMLETNRFSTASLYVLQHDAIAIAINMGEVENLYRAQLLLRLKDATSEQLNAWNAAFDAANALQTDADGWSSLIISSMKGDNSTFLSLNEKVQACTSAFTVRTTQ